MAGLLGDSEARLHCFNSEGLWRPISAPEPLAEPAETAPHLSSSLYPALLPGFLPLSMETDHLSSAAEVVGSS